MDRDGMMREAFGVREVCFRFAMKPLILSDEPYVRSGSSPPRSEILLPSRGQTRKLGV
jgi:hypothetical protein